MCSLTWKRQPELFKFDSRRHRCKAKPPAYEGPLAAKEITPDKRADSVNEKWTENLACCHKRIYLNACAAHDSFPLIISNRPRSRLLNKVLKNIPTSLSTYVSITIAQELDKPTHLKSSILIRSTTRSDFLNKYSKMKTSRIFTSYDS